MNKDVFAVICLDLCGAKILDSIHHHANGRGTTYGKSGALARIKEIESQGVYRCEIKRIPTGRKLDELWRVEKW